MSKSYELFQSLNSLDYTKDHLISKIWIPFDHGISVRLEFACTGLGKPTILNVAVNISERHYLTPEGIDAFAVTLEEAKIFRGYVVLNRKATIATYDVYKSLFNKFRAGLIKETKSSTGLGECK